MGQSRKSGSNPSCHSRPHWLGVMVRESAPLLKIATTNDFKQSLLSAQSVVYNQASTGIYLEKLFDRLGIVEQVKAKTTRYPDAAAVLGHISKGTPTKLGSVQPPLYSRVKARDSSLSARYR